MRWFATIASISFVLALGLFTLDIFFSTLGESEYGLLMGLGAVPFLVLCIVFARVSKGKEVDKN